MVKGNPFVYRYPVSIMRDETLKSELIRLRKEQSKTRRDEVFGGLSPSERAAYESKEDRIHELECTLVERLDRSLRNAA
jgi:hypothetical protein